VSDGSEVIWRPRITENFIKLENVTRKNEKRSLQISRDLLVVSCLHSYLRLFLSFSAMLDVRFFTSFDANGKDDCIAGYFSYTAVRDVLMPYESDVTERISINFFVWLHLTFSR
jgi:hypothetical protein